MLSVTFDRCAGWLHPAPGRRGVLMCGPLNHEILPLYQSWHALAAMIAEAGLPALRFDHHGTGDSLGTDRDSHRLEAWFDSIRAAARFMREELGIETLDLVGIRLGATLAALAAAEIGVERLVLIAPILSGRNYIREARARSRIFAGMWRLGEADDAHGGIVNDGFVITSETAAEISRLEPARIAGKPAGEILILSEKRPDATEKLTAQWKSDGCAVTRKSFDGLAGLFDSATLAKIPFDDWRAVTDFLVHDLVRGETGRVLLNRHVLSAPGFREERLTFGRDDRLAGVLCRPVAEAPSATVIFLNTGGNPHFGWGRMSVEHTRALAARGVASLRMDIAGLGDAVPLEGSPRIALYRSDSVADIREALDFLEARGLSNFAVVGHCSAAWLALNGALADERVRDLFLVNLQRFIWTGKENLEALMAQAYRATDSYLQEIGSGTIWRRVLKNEVNWPRLPGIACAMVRRVGERIMSRISPTAARIAGIETETARVTQMLAALSKRGANVLLVYSDTDPGREELARHFGPAGQRLQMPGIRTAIIANADHDITSAEARTDYLDLLVDHLGGAALPAEAHDETPAPVAAAA